MCWGSRSRRVRNIDDEDSERTLSAKIIGWYFLLNVPGLALGLILIMGLFPCAESYCEYEVLIGVIIIALSLISFVYGVCKYACG
jgi:hypothetical protein